MDMQALLKAKHRKDLREMRREMLYVALEGCVKDRQVYYAARIYSKHPEASDGEMSRGLARLHRRADKWQRMRASQKGWHSDPLIGQANRDAENRNA